MYLTRSPGHGSVGVGIIIIIDWPFRLDDTFHVSLELIEHPRGRVEEA